jgi:hypothetical protein
MEVLVDYTTTNIVYKSTQSGGWSKSTNGGNTFSAITTGAGAWVSPMVMHPSSNTTLFYGSSEVKKSVDGGNTFTNISTNLVGGYVISLAFRNQSKLYLCGLLFCHLPYNQRWNLMDKYYRDTSCRSSFIDIYCHYQVQIPIM